jgi:hypothetical protein
VRPDNLDRLLAIAATRGWSSRYQHVASLAAGRRANDLDLAGDLRHRGEPPSAWRCSRNRRRSSSTSGVASRGTGYRQRIDRAIERGVRCAQIATVARRAQCLVERR